jgi:hypothetical protein
MPKLIDITGQRFSRWVALRHVRSSRWWAKCDCGVEREVCGSALRKGRTSSCGCLVNRSPHITPLRRTPEYACWKSLRHRCERSSHFSYADYGGRGIKVCERWRDSYENFIADMGPRPSPQHSLDRIDVNGNYEPSNCRWATSLEQMNNRRDTIRVSFAGKTQSLSAWATELGFSKHTLADRYYRGWSPEKILTTPRRNYPVEA